MERSDKSVESTVNTLQYFSIYYSSNPSNISNNGHYAILDRTGRWLGCFWLQQVFVQPKENKPELQKKTTQTETTTVLCSHSVGLCLAAFAYCYAGD